VLQTQAVPLQSGVVPEQATQVAPHLAAVLQVWQVPLLHHLPEPQSASMLQPTHAVLAALQICPLAVQSVQLAPQLVLVVQVWQLVPLQ